MPSFCHLHCHTQYSLLDGATDIASLMKKAKADGMHAVALTDHGNMFGCYDFVYEAKKNDIKPILGCEFYLVENRHKQNFTKSAGESDHRYHQLLLAKNLEGYENISRLCSLGYIEGMYGKFPRIDKELLVKYHKGIIATSCCIGAEIPQAIMRGKLDEAETLLKWWLDLFGEDFYIEIQRQQGNSDLDNLGISQEDINQHLLRLAKKYNVKVIATNDVHYLNEEDAIPHDILLCINTAANVDDEDRFKFSSQDYFFKTTDEMSKVFGDVPFALDNTVELADKTYTPNLFNDLMLPKFPLPEPFKEQIDYLTHLVYEGAKLRYQDIDQKIKHRIDFEIDVIRKMDFAGYFLIVQDLIKAARTLGVSVGPGRGSAAGSVIAYCLTITDIDPIKYNLLFERFLNPERVSMPDIDIDFDDRGRDKVLDYVVKKYGHNQVAQIVTFGTMAAKSSIRDVARVKKLDLSIADKLSKLVPSRPGTLLREIIDLDKEISDDFTSEDRVNITELRKISAGQGLEADVLRTAVKLEGSVRNTGVHAAGVIIAPDDIMKFIPVSTAKDTSLWVTQVEGKSIENLGLLKMDFLGLTTLTIIDDTIINIKKRHGNDTIVDLQNIAFDDPKTLEIFQTGNTIGLFQFESEGMRGHLKNLKPSGIEDVIAMNALFRPGPMDYIGEFINRKHGRVPVSYPHEWMEEILKATYGIMVYQEQIMQAAQTMADYSLGEADILRRAMGKKKKSEMDKQKSIFVERALQKGISEEKAIEIFDVMAKFAAYGFNRSHAAAYSVLAFQTGYLKAHYPAEFMAAVLTHNKDNLEDLRHYLHEAKRMKLSVLGPDINESELNFTVNTKGEIRFGLSALKGVGEGPVEEILLERNKSPFLDFGDMVKRLNSRIFNKKVIESCVMGGAMDSFINMHRAQYFAPTEKFNSYIEQMIKWGSSYQSSMENTSASLFGDISTSDIQIPKPPTVEPWNSIYKLAKEVDIAGIYLSSHPLDDYVREIKYGSNCKIEDIEKFKQEQFLGSKVRLCGIVTEVQHRNNQKGEGYGSFKLADYTSNLEMRIYGEKYIQFKHYLDNGTAILVEGTYEKSKWERNKGDWEFRLQNVSLLSSALKNYTKKFTVYVPLHKINDAFIESIHQSWKKNKGNIPIKLEVIYQDQEVKLDFKSIKNKVEINSELLGDMEDLGVYYKLN